MLRSILFSFRLDLASELVPFWLHSGSSLEPFWFHFGSMFVPFGVHFGTIWGLWRGPVEEKLPRRTEGRGGQIAYLHFKRFWPQKGATRRPNIDQKSMKIDAKINGKFGWVFARPRERFWLTLGVFLGPWTFENECLETMCSFSKSCFLCLG